jgi:predicted RNA binding protein YcfA (HicA-like mRNA interferase family)
MAIKWRQLVDILEEDGWRQVRQNGSHRQFKHHSKVGLVTVAYHKLSDDVPVGTHKNILKQADLKV